MATFIATINKVLSRLREPQVSVIDNDYTRLIARFVNEAKEEVEDSWNWTVLRSTVAVTTSAGDNTYNLTGTTNRSRLLYAFNSTKKYEIFNAGSYNNSRLIELSNAQQQSPTHFDVYGIDSSTGELQVRLYPTPDAAYTLNFYCVIPQGELSTTTTEIKVPDNPIVQLAYGLAIRERGEDKGQLSSFQDEMYLLSLGKAISQDEALHQDETTWHPT
jgi:hypothetical protein